MKNNKKDDQIIYNELIKKSEFINAFSDIIQNEKSYLGKLLLQENYIFFNIMTLLRFIKLTINYSVLNEFDNNKKLNSNNCIMIKLPHEKTLFENYTLGKIVKLLKQFIDSGSDIIKKLEIYVENRNKLTHKIFQEYSNIALIQEDAEKIILGGEEILRIINDLNNQYKNSAYILIEKYHLSAFDN